MHINLRASEVSALSGRNMYKTSSQAIRDLVSTLVPVHDVHGDHLRRLTARIEERVRDGQHYSVAVKRRALDEDVCRQAERESMQVFDSFALHLPPMEKNRLRKSIRSVYLKDRGVLMELDTLRRLPSVGIPWHPTEKRQRFFSKTYVVQGCPHLRYTINGCVDGLEFHAGGDVAGLIEVKTRKDRPQYPMHDLDQVMMYIMVSDLPQGRLVQDVNGVIYSDVIMPRTEACERWERNVRPELERALQEVHRQIMERRGRELWHRAPRWRWSPPPRDTPASHEDGPVPSRDDPRRSLPYYPLTTWRRAASDGAPLSTSW